MDSLNFFLNFIFFLIPGSRWKVEKISYKISRYPTTKKLTNADVDSEIKKALDVWGEYTNLSFEKKDVGQVISPSTGAREEWGQNAKISYFCAVF